MGFEISDVAARLGRLALASRKSGGLKGFAQRTMIGAITRGIDVPIAQVADIGPAAEKRSEMPFLVAPRGDFHRAGDIGIGVEHARRFERIDDAKGAIEPAREILALQMRAREQFRASLAAGAEYIADPIDLG